MSSWIGSASMSARSPITRRWAVLMPRVRATKSGASPIGSMITNSVTKEVIRVALSISGLRRLELFLRLEP